MAPATRRRIVVASSILWLCALPIHTSASAAEPDRARPGVNFNRDIRPLLSGACFHCHGPDKKRRRARLRLDEERGIRRAFEPGKLEESEGWLRMAAEDPDDRMPPPDSHLELKPAELDLIRRWIEQGAEWAGHWAFVAPQRPEIPEVSARERVRTPVDAFVFARLEAEGLQPSPEEERERLIRRVTLDLTGLPPTLAEIDAFLADRSPGAYGRAVDRLLGSVHFGERMAVAWMDAARYGDTSVFHADGPRDMWAWRDWVIASYNNGKPFDEFTVEQLAGDLLPDATVEQKVATAFLRHNATTDEGGVIPEEYRVEYAVDRVRTTALVWMALSMQCSQCHDHKYDPISQREYYQFYAYFNQAADPGMQTRGGNQTPLVDVLDPAKTKELPSLRAELERIETAREQRAGASGPAFASWAQEARAQVAQRPQAPGDTLLHIAFEESEGSEVRVETATGPAEGRVQGPVERADGRSGKALRCDDKSFLVVGDLADFERDEAFSYGAWVKPEGVPTGAVLSRMDDKSQYRGYDLFFTGDRVSVHLIDRWPENATKVTTEQPVKTGEWHHLFATYDGSGTTAGIKIYVDGESRKLKVDNDTLAGTIRTTKPLRVGRRTPGAPFRGWVDDVRFYHRELTPGDVALLAGSDPVGPILAIAPADRSDQQSAVLRAHYLQGYDDEYRSLTANSARVKARIAAASRPLTTVMVMQDLPKWRETYVLHRGHYASPLEDQPVRSGVPEFLPQPAADAPANRLGLARWLVRPDHPLTARVAVNRYWYMLFGTGIVKTVEEFGAQGEWPSHPALLDWLAVDFVESGWDVKRLLRQIVLSSVYRQSSRVSPELLARDPENRLVGRGPRFRLQAEFVRDVALATSGLLVAKVGGPGVKPYQPPGLWNEVSLDANVRFVQDHGESLYRRSMYTYWKRSSPAPALTMFDTPTREMCTLRRSRTNTPLQALVTLNDPQFVEAARGLAERAVHEAGKTLDSRVVRMCRLVTALRPREPALRALQAAYADALAVFRSDPERAKALLAIGESERDGLIDAAEHAALTVVASIILNLDQTITRG